MSTGLSNPVLIDGGSWAITTLPSLEILKHPMKQSLGISRDYEKKQTLEVILESSLSLTCIHWKILLLLLSNYTHNLTTAPLLPHLDYWRSVLTMPCFIPSLPPGIFPTKHPQRFFENLTQSLSLHRNLQRPLPFCPTSLLSFWSNVLRLSPCSLHLDFLAVPQAGQAHVSFVLPSAGSCPAPIRWSSFSPLKSPLKRYLTIQTTPDHQCQAETTCLDTISFTWLFSS